MKSLGLLKMSTRKNFYNTSEEAICSYLKKEKIVFSDDCVVSRRTEGLANEVFFVVAGSSKYILKIYSKEKYFYSDYNVLISSFLFKPIFQRKLKILGKSSVLMDYVGCEANEKNISLGNLLSSIISLHETNKVSGVKKNYNLTSKQKVEMRSVFGSSFDKIFKSVFSIPFRKDILVHGDINFSNLRIAGEKVIIIDFDEAGFSDPVFEFAALYWSDIKECNKISRLEELIVLYNRLCDVKIDSKWLNPAIMIAGIHFYLWRIENITNQKLIEDARSSLRKYYKTVYGKIGHI